MSDMPQCRTRKLSLSEKISRLRVRLRNPEWRRYGKLLLLGKGAGIALVLGIIGVTSIFLGGHALAADPDLFPSYLTEDRSCLPQHRAIVKAVAERVKGVLVAIVTDVR